MKIKNRYPMLSKTIISSLLFSSIGLIGLDVQASSSSSDNPPPNILFIVMDDVGIDQMEVFGYGGFNPPKLPNMNTIAMKGVRFSNTWSMPSCSPSRATFFEGRYPLRTHVFNAITSNDLANSQVSPYEITTPNLLKQKGYNNGLFGKMHLSGSEINPATNPLGQDAYKRLGWDHFDGFLDGGPYPIDTTAGGIGGASGNGKTYNCGFIPNTTVMPDGGANTGACYKADNQCSVMSSPTYSSPGRACMEQGGILVPNADCQPEKPANLNFTVQNGYYTGAWVINDQNAPTVSQPASDAVSRGYRTTLEADRAIQWIKQQPANKPWMASVGFSAVHEPMQVVPQSLLPQDAVNTDGFNCETVPNQRILMRHMLEGIDHELGRLMVETGLARLKPDGTILYEPEKTNTMVVIIGDNGTWLTNVDAPFDPLRAKGSPYQTGVWVPLIVAGPMVKDPGRKVEHMVNGADLFRLFGEVAGINVDKAVPKSHVLDAKPMLPYLNKANTKPIRSDNYTQMGTNLRASDTPQYACVIKSLNTCTVIFPQQGVCEDQGGTWYGPGGAADPTTYSSCCQVNQALTQASQPTVDILPFNQTAIRNKNYKLVQMETENCSAPGTTSITNEFYKIDENVPVPELDRAQKNLLTNGVDNMDKKAKVNYRNLSAKLKKLQNSVSDCPGDGNLDKVVNMQDINGWSEFNNTNDGKSSWYDFNLDGLTDYQDLNIIYQNLHKRCK